MVVSDNGIGLPSNFNFKNMASLGWQLVDALTNQLGGNLHIKGTIGVECHMVFTLS
ncbi:MAG: hypothetical protein KME55_08455 [Nostoc indistinguendum CM1-VF10]|nr:hypothetical protein [Nostoc indistinguendum CM1-VF10]